MEWTRLLNESRRRPSSQDESEDHRTQFGRDYDRIVFSTPVRRLQDKAQVFPLEPHDGVRTRLTHSLEVSTVARDIAAGVCKRLVASGELPPQKVADVVDIAASTALLHDIGNPPFGHAGEQAMRDWLRDRMLSKSLRRTFTKKAGGKTKFKPIADDFLNFDGNAQMIRLVSRLQVLSDQYGLNLTYGTLSAACKYVTSSHALEDAPHSHSKPGYFDTERDLVQEVQTKTGTGIARHPITFIVEAADDIVNRVVDIEDGLKKRLYSWTELKEDLTKPEGEAGKASANKLKKLIAKAESVVDRSGLAGKAQEESYAQALRTQLMAALVPSVVREFEKQYQAIMSGVFGDELVRHCDCAPLYQRCKSLVESRVFTASDVLRLEVMGREIIRDLMDLYWEGTQSYDPSVCQKGFPRKMRHLISANYQHVYEEDVRTAPKGHTAETWSTYLRLRLVCDQVCGMTDTYAVREHKRLTNG